MGHPTAWPHKSSGSYHDSYDTVSEGRRKSWAKFPYHVTLNYVIRAKQTTLQVERHRLGHEQRKVFSKLTPGTPASSSSSSHTATTSTEHVTQVAETINRFERTVTNLNLLERAAVDRAYTRLTMAMRAFIGHVLGECFEARAFLVMDPQVAFGAPDGWPTYIHRAHSTWELAGIMQDIQLEPRSHELCFSHVYMKTIGFHLVLKVWQYLVCCTSYSIDSLGSLYVPSKVRHYLVDDVKKLTWMLKIMYNSWVKYYIASVTNFICFGEQFLFNTMNQCLPLSGPLVFRLQF